MAVNTLAGLRRHFRGRAGSDKVDALFVDPATNQMVPCKVTGVMEDEAGNDLSGWTKTLTIVVKPAS